MSRFVRASKYRHVFGQPAKKEHGIENVKVTTSAWDTNLINTSGTYLSLNWAASGGGAFAILPLPSPFAPLPHSLPYRLPDIIPLARGHSAPVLDTAWSPFNDSVVVSGGEDGKILVWKVEASEFDHWGTEHWEPRDFDPVDRIAGSARKIGQVMFHPTASHVLAAASGDFTVKLWDLGSTDEPRSVLNGHTDTVQGFAFNHTGTLLATTCRDRKLRLFDPRAGGDAVRVTDGHSGIKGSRVVWLGDKDRIATTGFGKMSDRQMSLWETGSLSNLKTVNIDQSAGVVMPFWSDNNIIFLAGKGDGNIRYYEYEADAFHPLSEHKSSDPQRGLAFLPRRALNVGECEIARGYKVYGSNIEPIAFVVPRKADSFQSDIYPLAPSSEPSLTAAEFFTGKTAQPKLISLESGTISSSSAAVPSAPQASATPAPSKTTSAPPALAAQAPPSRQESFAAASPIVASPVATPQPQASTPAPTAAYAAARDDLSSPSHASRSANTSSNDSALQAENSKLTSELREAKARIRNLELQVETMRGNAQRAAKALLESS